MKTHKPTTYALLVVDRSGSMAELSADVVGGLNSYLDSLKADEETRYRVTLALFNTTYELAEVDAKPRSFDKPLTTQWYRPRGGTALHYAVGRTITDFDARHPEPHPQDKVILFVNTDGQENSSHFITDDDGAPLHTGQSVKELLAAKEAQGWGIIYMGAGPAAWNQGDKLGYTSHVNTRAGGEGTRSSYVGMSAATRSFSRTGDVQAATAEIAKAAGADA